MTAASRYQCSRDVISVTVYVSVCRDEIGVVQQRREEQLKNSHDDP